MYSAVVQVLCVQLAKCSVGGHEPSREALQYTNTRKSLCSSLSRCTGWPVFFRGFEINGGLVPPLGDIVADGSVAFAPLMPSTVCGLIVKAQTA